MLQKGYLTVRQAASQYGLSRNQVTYLLRQGILKGRKVERDWLIEEKSLESYIANRPKPGRKERLTM
jgi:excisionase family DNA binding protein